MMTNKHNNKIRYFLIMSIFLLSIMACNLSSNDVKEAAATAAALATKAAPATDFIQEKGGAAVATLSAIDYGPVADKFREVVPDINGVFSVTVSEADLEAIIKTGQKQAEENGEENASKLQNVDVVLANGLIMLSGDVTSPVEARLVVNFRPYIEDGDLLFEIMGATLGSVAVPQSTLDSAETLLNNTLGRATGFLPAFIALSAVSVADGNMVLSGGQN